MIETFLLHSTNQWKEIQEGTVEKQSFLVAGITPEQFMQFIKFYQKLIWPLSIQLRYEKIIKALLETEQHNRQWLFTTFTLSKMFVILWDVFYKAKHLKTLIKGNCKKTRNIFNNWQRFWQAIIKSARYWLKADRICTLYNQIVCIIAGVKLIPIVILTSMHEHFSYLIIVNRHTQNM